MSKQDIKNVATLAAHLSERSASNRCDYYSPERNAANAMTLQRLGRRANRNAERFCNIPDYEPRYNAETLRIQQLAAAILDPYDLTASVSGDPRGFCLKIKGLPGNTWGGDEAGFGI